MALYLGNQKVSLRSGQDPTFDYGFDSNGRLVFANKNATEINNFLNYDSSYSEILDLSNLSKMEKVAVNGTVDRKMEGLKGLLVSPNAPFTGTSPQINVSYTGLNKSALVSLFESTPYNVGYTKVGSPTIVDGVASGFSGSDYLKTPILPLSSTNSFEINLKISVDYPDGTYTQIAGNDNTVSFQFGGSTKKLYAYVLDSNGRSALTYTYNYQSEISTIKLVYQNSTYSLYINGIFIESLAKGLPTTDYHFGIGTKMYRNSSGDGFLGSIDLNETYIKVNGVPWFGPGATKNLVPDGTVVGDVTVKDGIASGFSENDYLKINVVPNIVTSFEFGVKVNTGNLYDYCTIFGNNSTNRHSPQIEYNSSNNSIYFTTPLSDFTWGREIKYIVSSNTNYWFKYIFENNKCIAYVSSDGISYALINQVSQPSIGWDEWMQIGADQSKDYWKGSIDLNNTYIKVGSDYIYRGMVPQVKTCSVVGCTGTADLTQEDKNIILNKGWSLTVQ